MTACTTVLIFYIVATHINGIFSAVGEEQRYKVQLTAECLKAEKMLGTPDEAGYKVGANQWVNNIAVPYYTDKMACFAKCMLMKIGVMKGTQMDAAGAHKIAKTPAANKAVDTCKRESANEGPACKTGAKIYNCLVGAGVKVSFELR